MQLDHHPDDGALGELLPGPALPNAVYFQRPCIVDTLAVIEAVLMMRATEIAVASFPITTAVHPMSFSPFSIYHKSMHVVLVRVEISRVGEKIVIS